jgi:CRP-like cAMP-binding protein
MPHVVQYLVASRFANTRMTRKAGYEVGRYISLETVIEGTKEGYDRLPQRFRYADLERALPAVSRPTIARALRALSAEGVVRCVGRGRDAAWQRLPAGRSD